MELTDLTYSYCKELSPEEQYNLIRQINRCSCSIPSNIAEGFGKRTNAHTALISIFEEMQLLICKRKVYGRSETLENCLSLVEQVQKMIFAFREHVVHRPVSH